MSFTPTGPWLVTPDEVEYQNLALCSWVNGEPRQDSSSAYMIFSVPELVRHISRYMILEPGDVINTGTPAGGAMGRPDGAYLRDGDVVELEISGLGTLRSTARDA